MNYKKVVRQIISEIINDQMKPTMKYYAFDWDDNLMYMPTKIYLKDEDGKVVGMSTEDFAEYRTEIGKEPFEYEGHTIVGFDDEAFRDFKVPGDKGFIRDAMTAPTGPAWNDFVEAINNGSIFAIVTARGHTPTVLKNAIYNLIKKNKHGISEKELVKNLRKYRELADEDDLSDDELVRVYLDMNKYHPVTFGEGSAANPEQLKVDAMKEFMTYVNNLSRRLQEKAFMKNKISNYFIPYVGFSDDDLRNVQAMKKHFDDDSGLDIYHTGGGNKTKY
jgi:uncharacterized phage-associated protein